MVEGTQGIPPSSLWRHPDFLKLWTGRTISLVGSQVTHIALPLTAILMLQAEPVQLGMLKTASAAPLFLLGLVAGVWVDRLPRRPILIGADLGRAVLLGSIPLMAALGTLGMEHLYLVAFGGGVLGVLFGVAHRSYLPTLVPRHQLVEANGKLESSGPIAEIVGPGLAGALVQLVTAPFAVVVDALSFLVSALCVSFIRTPEPTPPAMGKSRSVRVDVREGLRLVMGNHLLRTIAVSAGLFELFDSAMMVMYILYMTNEIQVAPAIVGVIFGIGGIGGVLGALLASRVADRFGLGTALIGGVCLAVVGDLLIPVAGIVPLAAVPILAIAELLVVFGVLIFGVNLVSLRQAVTPPHLQGRMNATMSVIIGGPGLIGALAGGLLGEVVGLAPVFVVAALGTSVAALYLFLSPVRAIIRPPESLNES